MCGLHWEYPLWIAVGNGTQKAIQNVDREQNFMPDAGKWKRARKWMIVTKQEEVP